MISFSQAVRSTFFLIAILWFSPIWGEEVISDDAKAKEILAHAREDLREGDVDPQRIIAATLGFTRLLDYYKSKGDIGRVCEMQANVYWCKKQMNLDILQLYLEQKGEFAKETYQRSVEIVMAEIPKSQADDYFSRAEAYAKTNPNDEIMIAIRYFEVADRFTGLPVSLKAQKLSLEYLRKAASSGKNTKDFIGNELRALTVTVGELPENANNAINESNASIGKATSKASQELEQARCRAIDALLKEADIEQKRGSLETLIALQSQIANMDVAQGGITQTGKYAVDLYLAAKGAILKRTNSDIITQKLKLSDALENIQKEEVRKGNISGATAIKAARESILLGVNDGAAASVKPPIIGRAAKAKHPDDAKQFGMHYYKLVLGKFTWDEAKRRCEDMGGYLVCIGSEKENAFINNLANRNNIWLGATDERSEARWLWITGEKFEYANWHRGEPTNSHGKEHYLNMTENGTWYDVTRTNGTIKGLVCEWDQ